MKRVASSLALALARSARADDGFQVHGGVTLEGGFMKTFQESDAKGGLRRRANALNLSGFGYDLRLAFFAKGAEKTRQGVSIVTNVHHAIGSEQSYVNITLGLGYEWY